MAERLRFHPLMVSDLRNAIRWYDDISVELGNRFRKSVDGRFDAITQRPESFAFAFEEVRFIRLRRFPYLVLFRLHQNAIHVLGIFHSASDPERWRQRAVEP